MFWLIRCEAHPEWFTHSLDGYDGLIGRDILVSDTWMRVLDNGKPIGYSRTSVDVNDNELLRHIVFENRTHVRMEMMGRSQLIRTVASAYLDMSYRMQEFEFSMHTGVIDVDVTGKRSEEGPFDLVINTGGQTRRMRLDIPDDIVIHSPMTALAVRDLDVGEYVKVKTLNPVTLGQETATVRALLRETIELDDGPVEATKLEIEYAGSRSHAWVDQQGQLLRQKTPIGWTLEKCRPDQMFEEEETTKDTKKKTTTEARRRKGEREKGRMSRESGAGNTPHLDSRDVVIRGGGGVLGATGSLCTPLSPLEQRCGNRFARYSELGDFRNIFSLASPPCFRTSVVSPLSSPLHLRALRSSWLLSPNKGSFFHDLS